MENEIQTPNTVIEKEGEIIIILNNVGELIKKVFSLIDQNKNSLD